MRPVLFQIGDFRFYSFGLMAALALIVPGLTIVRPLVRRRGVPAEFAYELIIAAGVGGFVFARIYYLIENYAAIKADFWQRRLQRRRLRLVRRPHRRLPRRRRLDAHPALPARRHRQRHGAGRRASATPSAASAASSPATATTARSSTLPWAMGYPHGTVPTPPGVRVQPTPIYEIIAMGFVVWILWRLATRYDKSGWWTFGWFLVLSGIERFLVEFVRRNPIWFWHLTQPQWVSIVSVVIGVVLILVYGKKPAVLTVTRRSRAGRRPGGRREPRSARARTAGLVYTASGAGASLGTRSSGQGAVSREAP